MARVVEGESVLDDRPAEAARAVVLLDEQEVGVVQVQPRAQAGGSAADDQAPRVGAGGRPRLARAPGVPIGGLELPLDQPAHCLGGRAPAMLKGAALARLDPPRVSLLESGTRQRNELVRI